MKHRRASSTVFAVSAALVSLCALASLSGCSGKEGSGKLAYKTAEITSGTIEELVSSTGNLKAVGTVDVLAQVTGTLEKVHVDFNDTVRKNQPLAEINTDKLRITLKEAQAALEKARAQAEYDELEYKKSTSLHDSNLISDTELAGKKLSSLTSKAALVQAEAAYEEARLNIESYAVILSPISGIVLDRAVAVGDTVVSSGGTNTTMFTLAENLNTMEIEASVDELDISRIKQGQTARFTVEAYTDKKFTGKVRQIQVVPTTSDNVVSYTVIITTDNKQSLLLPGMTATIEFIITEKSDVVLVPSTALRFTPSQDIQKAARRKGFEERLKEMGKTDAEVQEEMQKFDQMQKGSDKGGSLLGGGMPGGAGAPPGGAGGPPPGAGGPGGGPGGPGGSSGSSSAKKAQTTTETRKTIWLLGDDGEVSMRPVTIGSTDGTNTEILNGNDLIGKKVITRSQQE